MSVDYFLKVDGIDGESMDDKHKNEIEVARFVWKENQSGTFAQGAGGGAGKVAMSNFDFVMRTNKSSPKLMLACATGQHIKEATLTCRKAGGGQQEFYKITMKDVLVSRYLTGSDGSPSENGQTEVTAGGYDEGVPTDLVSLNFAKIECEYRAAERRRQPR